MSVEPTKARYSLNKKYGHVKQESIYQVEDERSLGWASLLIRGIYPRLNINRHFVYNITDIVEEPDSFHGTKDPHNDWLTCASKI